MAEYTGGGGGGGSTSPAIEARVKKTTQQSVASGAWTAISWDGTDFDTSSFWSSGNPTRLTIPENGTYIIIANLEPAYSATGVRGSRLRLNGTTSLSGDGRPASGGNLSASLPAVVIRKFNQNDYVEVEVYQDTGSALNYPAGVGDHMNMSIVKLN